MPDRYRIMVRQSAAREIEGIGQTRERERIIRRIAALATDPRPAGCTRLTGRDAYRVRQGSHRILYTIADDLLVVEVVKVGHRSDVYR